MSLAPTRHSPLAPVLTLLALTLTPRPSLIRCVLAEASAAGGDKAKAHTKAACVADKVWALTLKAKDSFVWQDASSATEREGAALPY